MFACECFFPLPSKRYLPELTVAAVFGELAPAKRYFTLGGLFFLFLPYNDELLASTELKHNNELLIFSVFFFSDWKHSYKFLVLSILAGKHVYKLGFTT